MLHVCWMSLAFSMGGSAPMSARVARKEPPRKKEPLSHTHTAFEKKNMGIKNLSSLCMEEAMSNGSFHLSWFTRKRNIGGKYLSKKILIWKHIGNALIFLKRNLVWVKVCLKYIRKCGEKAWVKYMLLFLRKYGGVWILKCVFEKA